MHSELTRFATVSCSIHFWLMWCKNYQNWSRIAKVVANGLLSHFTDHSRQTLFPIWTFVWITL